MELTGNSEEEPRDVLHLGAAPLNSAPFGYELGLSLA